MRVKWNGPAENIHPIGDEIDALYLEKTAKLQSTPALSQGKSILRLSTPRFTEQEENSFRLSLQNSAFKM